MGKPPRRKGLGEWQMMERAHNFLLSLSEGAEKLDHENWCKKLEDGPGEDSVSDDPALGLELDDDSPQHSTEVYILHSIHLASGAELRHRPWKIWTSEEEMEEGEEGQRTRLLLGEITTRAD